MGPQTSWRDGGHVRLVLRSVADRYRSSLFGVPALWLIASLLAAQVATAIDRRVGPGQLPRFMDTTVESARAILGAVSSGTIAAASVVFSLTLVAVQLSTSVYSSRVLRTFLRDRFQQHMIGLVTATFFYSLLVLREVRGPLEDSGSAYIPRISVFLAVVLALGAVMALLASISHTAQSLRVSAVTRSLVAEVVSLVEQSFAEPSAPENDDRTDQDVSTQGAGIAPGTVATGTIGPPEVPKSLGVGAVLLASKSGWLQQISVQALRGSLSEGSTLRLEVSVGSYIIAGTPLLTLWPTPTPSNVNRVLKDLHNAFGIGAERSLHEDVAFGIAMVEDVAVKALSPGVNDPNTAKAVIVQLGEIVLAIMSRELTPARLEIDGCELFRPTEPKHWDYVSAAFNQIRLYAKDQPPAQLVLAQTLASIGEELRRRRRSDPQPFGALSAMLGYLRHDLMANSPEPDARTGIELIDRLDWFRHR